MKKSYEKPTIEAIAIESEQVLLAGSDPTKVKANMGNGEELEYDGDTQKDHTYIPW